MPRDLPVVPQFQEAVVAGGAAKYDELVSRVLQRLVAPWEHDRERENEPILQRTGNYRVFWRHEGDLGPGLRLFLLPDEAGRVYVPNIVPEVSGELTIQQYNAALTDFVDRLLRPAAAQVGLSVEVSPPEFDVTVELGEDVATALGAFSAAANRSTGNSHPLDRERWNRFVVLTHRSGKRWPSTQLSAWLVLDGWSDEVASDLAIEYEAGLDLLDYVDNH